MNLQVPVIVPPETVQVNVVEPVHRLADCPLFESVTLVSEALKQLPDTVTVVPPPPEAGLSLRHEVVVVTMTSCTC